MRTKNRMLLASLVLVGACVPRPAQPPAAEQPTAQPQPAQAPAAPAPEPETGWADLPLSDGDWAYRDEGAASLASFGRPGQEPQFALRCDKGRHQLLLMRQGVATGDSMTVRTSYGGRSLPIAPQPGTTSWIVARLGANDPLLDSMVFSRGRVTVEVPGTTMLVMPAWAEPARAIEDCRG